MVPMVVVASNPVFNLESDLSVGHGDLGMFGYREKVRSVWLLSVDTLDC